MQTLDSSLPVIAIQILGWKTERWGEPVKTLTADTVLLHQTEHTVSESIKRIMERFNLVQSDIINITAERNLNGDTGSHDFWMFVRNPNYHEPNLEDPKPFVKAGDAG